MRRMHTRLRGFGTTSPAMAAAYSTRKIGPSYSGPALRVRRSSDSVEADIGFLADGTLDETALLAHVGANSGFVSKLYDQSGNGRDLVQATAAKQPRIVLAGVVDRIAGTTTVGSPELVTNGMFNSDTSGWSTISATLGVVSGAMRVTSSSDGVGRGVSTSLATTAGKTYNYSLTLVTNPTGKGYSLNIGSAPVVAMGTPATYIGTFTATAATTSFLVTCNTGGLAGEYIDLDNISVKEVTAVNKPAVRTDGVSQTMVSPAFALNQPLTRSTVLQFLSTAANQVFTASSANGFELLFSTSVGTLGMDAGATLNIKSGFAANDSAVVTEVFSGAGSLGSYNGASVTGNTGTNGVLLVAVGARGNGNNPANALFGDIIIFPTALSTNDRQLLEANQKQFWGTP